MANWVEGVFKVRGTRVNIKKFLVEGLDPLPAINQQLARMRGKEIEKPKMEIKEDEWYLTINSPNGLYIKGTRRAFFESEIEWWFDDSHLEVLTIDSFKQAWAVDAPELAEISKRFDVDLKIYTFEKGMQFNQDIEIHKGEIIKDNEIKFNDYDWECLFPNLGG